MTDEQTAYALVQLARIADSLERLTARPQPAGDDVMLTTAQVAGRLQLAESTVLDMRERGDLKAVKVQRVWRFPQSELRRFEEGVARPVSNVIRMGSRTKGTRR